MKVVTKIVEFTADWCTACERYKELLPRLCKEFDVQLEISNISEDSHLSFKHEVGGLPTLLFMDDDDYEVGRIEGAYSETRLREKMLGIMGEDNTNTRPRVCDLTTHKCDESL